MNKVHKLHLAGKNLPTGIVMGQTLQIVENSVEYREQKRF
jgi:hypothetical protein